MKFPVNISTVLLFALMTFFSILIIYHFLRPLRMQWYKTREGLDNIDGTVSGPGTATGNVAVSAGTGGNVVVSSIDDKLLTMQSQISAIQTKLNTMEVTLSGMSSAIPK